MAEKGGQKGNTNAARGTQFRDALRRVMARRDLIDGIEGATIEKIAEKYIDSCIEGSETLLKDFFDRSDGKVKVAVEHSTDPDNPLMASVTVSFIGQNAPKETKTSDVTKELEGPIEAPVEPNLEGSDGTAN